MNFQDNPVTRKFFIRTFGCKVNQYESQAIREMLLDAGYAESDSKESAGIFIVNTCTVTNEADKEARYVIKLLHRANPDAKIIVTGCLAKNADKHISSLPGVSNIILNKDKPRLAKLIARGGLGAFDLPVDDDPDDADLISLKIRDFKNHSKAFLKIQDGCENFCSYCKVPYVRGGFKSKPIEDITQEFRGLVLNGFREIVLTGICLGSWGADLFPSYAARGFGGSSPGLANVLRAIDTISGDFRVRLSSIEPKYVTDELIDIIAGNKRVCRHLHIPLQSGDDSILRKMNRPYTAAHYKEIIKKARKKLPGIAITTDVMIGFPGEADSHFRNTVDVLKEIGPLKAHTFRFSRREGTAAYLMGAGLPIETLDKRYADIEAVVLDTSFIFRSSFMGTELDVLVESRRDKITGKLCGYSDNYIKVSLDGQDSIMRRVVPVTITDVAPGMTTGVYQDDNMRHMPEAAMADKQI